MKVKITIKPNFHFMTDRFINKTLFPNFLDVRPVKPVLYDYALSALLMELYSETYLKELDEREYIVRL